MISTKTEPLHFTKMQKRRPMHDYFVTRHFNQTGPGPNLHAHIHTSVNKLVA
jgi:hypothetical protein